MFKIGLTLLTLLFFVSGSTYANDGDIASDWGPGGKGRLFVGYDMGSKGDDTLIDMIRMPHGAGVIAVGRVNCGIPNQDNHCVGISRILPDGSKAILAKPYYPAIPHLYAVYPASMAVDSQGKILVSGTYKTLKPGSEGYFVARFDLNGQPLNFIDNTTNVIYEEAETFGFNSAVVSAPGGGFFFTSTGDCTAPCLVAIKFNPSGKKTESFGVNGEKWISFDSYSTIDLHSAAYRNGYLVLAGQFADGDKPVDDLDMFALRLNSLTGDFDFSFGKNGFAQIALDQGNGGSNNNDSAENVLIASDNSVVLAGYAALTYGLWRGALVKLNSVGQIDFVSYSPYDLKYETFTDIVQQGDGKFIVAGVVKENQMSSYFMQALRFSASGSLDASFAENGRRIVYSWPAAGYTKLVVDSYEHIILGATAESEFGLSIDFFFSALKLQLQP